MRTQRVITVVDAHAEGALGRVIVSGVGPVPGRTMLEKARHLERNDDGLRRLLLREPRGGVTTMANLILPPVDPKADVGLIIMESMGYPAMSGSNSMCAATVLVETGMVLMREPMTRLLLDTPGGLVAVDARCRNGRCERVEIQNVPAFATHLGATIKVEDLGTLRVDVAYGGVFFVVIDAPALGLSIRPESARELVTLGNRIVGAASRQLSVVHPDQPGVMGDLFALFAGPVRQAGPKRKTSRNAVVVPPGWIDRCPTGTGTSARLAVLHAKGEIGRDVILDHASILGSRFEGRIVGTTRVGRLPAVRTAIAGRAWISGIQHFFLDPDDPFPEGFTLPDVWPNGSHG
jgi:proline racemase